MCVVAKMGLKLSAGVRHIVLLPLDCKYREVVPDTPGERTGLRAYLYLLPVAMSVKFNLPRG